MNWSLIALMQSALAKLPNYEGTVYRAVKERPLGKKGYTTFMNEHSAGHVVNYMGFTATSQIPEQILRGRLKLTIFTKNGVDISAFSSKPEQKEVLISANAQFQILEKKTRPSGAIDIWLQHL